jgi:hypothetical protein
MIFNYGYLLHEAERTRTQAGQRQADALVGEIAAAVAKGAESLTRLWMSLAASARAPRAYRHPGRPAGPAMRAHR